jgi:HSP20 family protein
MRNLREEIEDAFDRWMPTRRGKSNGADPFGWMPALWNDGGPAVEVEEEETEIRVRAELPGLGKDDFKVEVMGNRLTIRGEKRAEREEKKGGYHYSELEYGAFARTIDLPGEVEPAKTEAKYKDGVLEVRLPKTEKARANRVKVEVA